MPAIPPLPTSWHSAAPRRRRCCSCARSSSACRVSHGVQPCTPPGFRDGSHKSPPLRPRALVFGRVPLARAPPVCLPACLVIPAFPSGSLCRQPVRCARGGGPHRHHRRGRRVVHAGPGGKEGHRGLSLRAGRGRGCGHGGRRQVPGPATRRCVGTSPPPTSRPLGPARLGRSSFVCTRVCVCVRGIAGAANVLLRWGACVYV